MYLLKYADDAMKFFHFELLFIFILFKLQYIPLLRHDTDTDWVLSLTLPRLASNVDYI